MGFSEVLQWWQDEQLRILVLASLFIQWFLFIAAPLRKRRIQGLLRFFIWLAYLSSDAVAIYALATLFNRQKKEVKPGPQALWGPILLVHLGGQEAITAYNIEDNELWRRHVLTAVSQVTVAIYVFAKSQLSFYNDTGIFQAALLVFIYGIAKCLIKPWELKRVSINSLVDSSDTEEKGEINSLEEYVQAAKQYLEADDHGNLQPSGGDDICKVDEVWRPYNLCVDLAPPYSGRLSCLKHLVRNQDEAHRLVQSCLSVTFAQLYTKEALYPANWTTITAMKRWKILMPTSACLRVGTSVVLMGATLWFPFLNNRSADYEKVDVAITYALLACALVMDFLVPAQLYKIKQRFNEKPWPDEVSQYNLIGYLARNKKHSWLVGTDLLDQHWCMKPSKRSHEITKLVHGHIARGWTSMEGHIHIADAETFRVFNDSRGQCALDMEEAHTTSKHLRSSVSRPFDESVLLWHLATDFCFFDLHPNAKTPSCEAARRCREMSNYMAYLLFVNPEMLMPGARRSLFRAAYSELAGMLKGSPDTARDETGLAHKVIQLLKRDGAEGSSVIHEAWRVAKDLMELRRGDEQRMWKVIEGVWVEMLCFSAGRCRGYLHAKSLGTGGEYLSYVWLLLLYMGMETFSEKIQRTELYEDCAAAGHTSAAATAMNGQNV